MGFMVFVVSFKILLLMSDCIILHIHVYASILFISKPFKLTKILFLFRGTSYIYIYSKYST